jgi:zinc D-Ala-D-Ala dipeptidase
MDGWRQIARLLYVLNHNFLKMLSVKKIKSWIKYFCWGLAIAFFCYACQTPTPSSISVGKSIQSDVAPAVKPETKPVVQPTPALSNSKPSATTPAPMPERIPANPSQLVDIQIVDRRILLDIRYATTNNFLNQKVYPVGRCLLRWAAAEKLVKVQTELAKQGLGLKVYDCYRPLSVQKQMWKVLPDDRYVANPVNGSRHNRASAVDLTLVDRTGKELEMPSDFDEFSERSHLDYQGGSEVAQKNRRLLTESMVKQGFLALQTEWWHFDLEGWQNFPIMDTPLNQTLVP